MSLYIVRSIAAVFLSLFVFYRIYSRLLYYRVQHRLPDYSKLTGVPPPVPLLDFDIMKTKARPYRPFRWRYHQNMALKKMDPDWWLELESTYKERISQRQALYAEHGDKVLDAMPGSELACRELVEMVVQFLCERYPRQFTYNENTGVFHNHILNISTNIPTVRPLVFLLDNVPEDFLITQKDDKTGLYYFRAGIACSAIGWNVSTKIGKPLEEIHKPVPDYKDKIAMSVDRYFTKLVCDKPIQRGAWGIEKGQPLFLVNDDSPEREQQDPNLDISDIHLRVDWQTLRRMPRSNAIVFNYKALFTPITQFRLEPYIPKLVLTVLKEGQPSILAYKGTSYVEHKVIPALEAWAQEQVEKGWVEQDWKVRTLDEDPFFPGWEKTMDM